jgi:hypothetical protein
LQLSQLADRVPEGYNISAYLILSLTLGNVIPLLANSSLKECRISDLRKIIGYILAVGCLCGVSVASCSTLNVFLLAYLLVLIILLLFSSCVDDGQVAMALLWHVTLRVGSHDYSVIFCLLFFVVGACSSTSNVTHFTYVSVFPSNETTALSTGMAIGSMLAGVLGILQGTLLGDAGMSIAANYLLVAGLYLPALLLTWSGDPLVLPPCSAGQPDRDWDQERGCSEDCWAELLGVGGLSEACLETGGSRVGKTFGEEESGDGMCSVQWLCGQCCARDVI